ncbi:hypothetical protein OAV47_00150 [bacterium]|nr:hypothetical protein [bacterium]
MTRAAPPRDLNELGHPGAADHHGIDPLDGEDARSARRPHGLRGTLAQAAEPVPQPIRDSLPFGGLTERLGHPLDVPHDPMGPVKIIEPRRPEAHKLDALARDGLERRLDVADRHRADIAQVLGQHDVRPGPLEPLGVHVIDREGVGQDAPNVTVDVLRELADVDL